MAKNRFRVPTIMSFTPAVDSRGSDQVFAITGRNFVFDSKGPKSAFGTRLLALGQVIEDAGGVAQSIDVGTKSFLFTTRGAFILAEDGESWIQLLTLIAPPNVANADDKKWTAAYLSKGIYFCHPTHGFFKYQDFPTRTFLPMDQDVIPGFPYKPQSICETNGRLVVLGIKYVAWSSPSGPEKFIPELGGAGQQLLSDRVSGRPMTMIGFQTGFIVWTENDCLTAEFIGGDTVFRFDRMTTSQLPLGAFCVENFPNGTQCLCTKQGLFQVQSGQEPQSIAPLFSEFLRVALEHEPGIHVRLTYEIENDRLYVAFRDWTNHYVITYALAVSMDKWGIFSERHLGLIRYKPERGAFGYVDAAGVVHRFVESFTREKTAGEFIGLDSNIEIGYVKPPELQGEVDTLLEMQEILLGGVPARPSWSVPRYIDMGWDDPTPPTDSCLNFLTDTYVVDSVEFPIDELVSNFEQIYRSPSTGYALNEAARPSMLGVNDGPLVAAMLDNLTGVGVTMLFEVSTTASATLFGHLLWWHCFILDGQFIKIDLDYVNQHVRIYDQRNNIDLIDPITRTTGVLKIAVTLSSYDELTGYHYAISVNGGAVSTLDIDTYAPIQPFDDFGGVPAFGNSPSFISPNNYFNETVGLRRFCVFPAIPDDELQLLSEL